MPAISELAKKLGIKPGLRVLIMNPPNGYKSLLEPLPKNVQVLLGGSGPFDVVQCFVSSQADVEKHARNALSAAAPGARVWLTYPKKTSKVRSDISRYVGWDAIWAVGWEGMAIASVDETWSAMRFRPSAEVKSRRTKE